jgi:hypothetical protein
VRLKVLSVSPILTLLLSIPVFSQTPSEPPSQSKIDATSKTCPAIASDQFVKLGSEYAKGDCVK